MDCDEHNAAPVSGVTRRHPRPRRIYPARAARIIRGCPRCGALCDFPRLLLPNIAMSSSPTPHATSAESRSLARCAPLPQLQVVDISGADAVEFLHSQLTQDVRGLSPARAAFAGYCTAKGRLLATMALWRVSEAAGPGSEAGAGGAAAGAPAAGAAGAAGSNGSNGSNGSGGAGGAGGSGGAAGADTSGDTVRTLVRADLAPALIKRLQMFVLRAKVKLAPAPLQVAGVWLDASRPDAAESAEALGQAAGGPLPRDAWQRAELPTGTWIALPATTTFFGWWWVASDAQRDAAASLRALLNPAATDTWREAELAAGLPWVGASMQDTFIPQTLNLDLIGAVSFTKGCYPGQEVVARSHYRGKVKRRMAFGRVSGRAGDTIAPGTDVYDPAQPNEPCGRVLDAAGGPDAAVLFETTLSALGSDSLRLGALDGPEIQSHPLPYALE